MVCDKFSVYLYKYRDATTPWKTYHVSPLPATPLAELGVRKDYHLVANPGSCTRLHCL